MNETFTIHPELGREVPVGGIDKELHKLWAEDEARTNASLVNLAVYSEREGSLVENSRAMQELTREHACRALLIGIDREASEASIKAWITAHCHLSHGQKSVCCEQIAFSLTGRATGRLRNTVFAHLNSDLPLILWWQGELSPIFSERFYSLIDRFVFDSAEWSDPVGSFALIADAMDGSTQMMAQDLSWTRSFQFRVSVAALFDDPVAQDALGAIESVEIRHHPDNRVTALQLLSWLAVQAKWRDGLELGLADSRQTKNARSYSFELPAGGSVRATLVGDEASAPLGSLVIRAGEVSIEVTREAGASYLLRRVSAPGHVTESPGPVDSDNSVDAIGEQLSRGGKNSLFRKILPRFQRLLAE
ncbi:glucose-6-phosphate dehydrogenase assembly protein OpcA [Haloferula sp.]|uniref:glucose-6-phosphate dehydrogenase assembly protein OpcA n=1 Tax=Haloferula sp. TaxID=2497595 RepID=UPI00329A8911